MILIISSPEDVSTSDVIQWLKYYDKEFLRISVDTVTELVSLNMHSKGTDLKIRFDDEVYSLEDFSMIWYRRSFFLLEELKYNLEGSELNTTLNRQLQNENGVLQGHILNLLARKSLNTQKSNLLNKLDVLSECRVLGIQVPPSLVTTSKAELGMFLDEHQSIISKNLAPGVFMNTNDYSLTSTTSLVTSEMFEELPNNFMPMLFQKTVDKVFEIRSFYLKGEFYSSAIFSQQDDKTKIDFRNYNFEKPNRTPPFNLPYNIQERLRKLMERFNLNSGSIDLLVTPEGKFIFLEVNPVGQFSQVSKPCNYYLEKEIALVLSNQSTLT